MEATSRSGIITLGTDSIWSSSSASAVFDLLLYLSLFICVSAGICLFDLFFVYVCLFVCLPISVAMSVCLSIMSATLSLSVYLSAGYSFTLFMPAFTPPIHPSKICRPQNMTLISLLTFASCGTLLLTLTSPLPPTALL